MYDGYPFIFQMNEYPLVADGLLEYTMQYRFTSLKSHHKYIVRVERYKEHSYCVKFFDKANMSSNKKFSLRTGTFEVRTILFTIFHIMQDVLKRDKKASFFFIGERDEKDRNDSATRRYRIYVAFVLSLVGAEVFSHHRFDYLSLYMLVNRAFVADINGYTEKITRYVAETLAE